MANQKFSSNQELFAKPHYSFEENPKVTYQIDLFDVKESYANFSKSLAKEQRRQRKRILKRNRTITQILGEQGFNFARLDRLNGDSKYTTLDCKTCTHYRKINEVEVCTVGQTLKELFKSKKQKHCAYTER